MLRPSYCTRDRPACLLKWTAEVGGGGRSGVRLGDPGAAQPLAALPDDAHMPLPQYQPMRALSASAATAQARGQDSSGGAHLPASTSAARCWRSRSAW